MSSEMIEDPGVVVGESRTHVGCQADVVLLRRDLALQNEDDARSSAGGRLHLERLTNEQRQLKRHPPAVAEAAAGKVVRYKPERDPTL